MLPGNCGSNLLEKNISFKNRQKTSAMKVFCLFFIPLSGGTHYYCLEGYEKERRFAYVTGLLVY